MGRNSRPLGGATRFASPCQHERAAAMGSTHRSEWYRQPRHKATLINIKREIPCWTLCTHAPSAPKSSTQLQAVCFEPRTAAHPPRAEGGPKKGVGDPEPRPLPLPAPSPARRTAAHVPGSGVASGRDSSLLNSLPFFFFLHRCILANTFHCSALPATAWSDFSCVRLLGARLLAEKVRSQFGRQSARFEPDDR